MKIVFREATEGDLADIIALLHDDVLGETRETLDVADYVQAFRDMGEEPCNWLVVGESEGEIVATYQLTTISGVSLKATRRAQIEGVRVAASMRGLGVGARLIADAENRARQARATLMQLTSNRDRDRTRAFYEREGYTPSHIGFKKWL